MEIWKPIKSFEGLYEVSNEGRVRTLHTGCKRAADGLLKPMVSTPGYLYVNLCKNGSRKRMVIHRLVAQAFLDGLDANMEVNHLNGIKTDNRLENLEVCTHSENIIHSHRVLGRNVKYLKGEEHGMSRLTLDDVSDIRKAWDERSESQADMARRYNVSTGCISKIVLRRTWIEA